MAKAFISSCFVISLFTNDFHRLFVIFQNLYISIIIQFEKPDCITNTIILYQLNLYDTKKSALPLL